MEQKPSVGRVVHYVAYGTPGGEFPAGVCRAAVITEINEQAFADGAQFPFGGTGRVGVCVLNPTGLFFNKGIPYDPGAERCSCGQLPNDPVHTSAHPDSHDPGDVRLRYLPGTWHWPERV